VCQCHRCIVDGDVIVDNAAADSWATASLNTIGGASVVVPYWTHQIQAAALGLVPTVLWNKYKYGFGVGIRKRGMKKEEDAKSK
jgi:hypothetical protein